MKQANLETKEAQGIKASTHTVALSIKTMSQFGIMNLQSSVPMEIPKDAADRRQLEEHLKQSIKVTLFRGESESAEEEPILIPFKITDFSENGILCQFYFKDPKLISTGGVSDIIIVQITDISAFVGQNGQLPSTLFIATQLPRQMALNSTEASVAEGSEDAGSGAQVVVAGNFAMNLAM